MPKFNDRLVAALSCPVGRKDALFFDGDLKGFGVRVTSAGSRTFLFQYRSPNGVRRLPIGMFGSELTTAQARAKAERLRGETRDGRDPVADRATARIACIAAEAAAKQAAVEAAFTVGRLIEVWDEKHLAGLRQSYRRDALGRLRLHLASLLERPADAVTKTEIVRVLDRVAAEAGETTARRVMSYGRAAWSWTRRRGAIETNPFEGLPAQGRDVPRDRVLEPAEVGAVWNAAAELGPVHGGFARLLLLTLCRREEAARMRWIELSRDRAQWTIPAGRSKNRKAHVVHLTSAARQILDAVPRRLGSDLVFTAGDAKALTTFSYIARRLGQTGDAARWRLHDFRRTGVTVLASLGIPPHVCDRLLNHTSGAISGVAAIYQRHDFAKERTDALEAWSDYVLPCAERGDMALPKSEARNRASP